MSMRGSLAHRALVDNLLMDWGHGAGIQKVQSLIENESARVTIRIKRSLLAKHRPLFLEAHPI